ncbi:hypothetical protein O0L34_g7504 [Tuta absoluta]|nr:hypothetical protein O0L34_g7504 [Tuta absoluta]
MFKNTYQSGLLSIFYSCGSNPLAIWDSEVHNGHIKRLTDQEVNSVVLEIVSTNVATTYISCPKNDQVLGIKLPFLVMIVKNLKRYFSFEITILDDKNMRRRFRISNFQSTTKIRPFCTTMPIGLSGGWNQIQFNLADFTRRAYGSQFIESLRVQIHANVRLRRIYFADRLYTEEELPQEYKLYLPLDRKIKKKDGKKPPAEIPPVEGVPEVGDIPAEGIPPTAVPSKAVSMVKTTSQAVTVSKAALSSVVAPKEAGEGVPEGQAPLAEAEGTPAVEGEATPIAEREGAPVAEGEGAPAVEGEAAPAVEGEAEPAAEGEAVPVEGEAPVEAPPTEGEPTEAAAPAEGEAPAEVPTETPAEAPAEAAPAEEAPPTDEALPADEAPADTLPAE